MEETRTYSKIKTEDVLKADLGTKLWFVWMVVWGSLCLAFFSTGVMIHHIFEPTLEVFHRWSGAWARTTLRGFGMQVRVTQHAPLDPKQPYIFVSNHQNSLDILVEAGFVPVPFGFLAKTELRSVPFLGQVLKTFCVFVDRSTPRKALESLKQGGEIIQAGHSILVYPEGERTWSNEMVEWMRGAFDLAINAGVPIVPVTLVDNYRLLDERCYIGTVGCLHCIIHPPFSLEGKSRKDIPQIMEQVKAIVESGL